MLTLYHHPASPSCAKARFVLQEKGIPYEDAIVDVYQGEQFSAAYLAVNEAAIIPTLLHNGRPVRESLVICEYLEEAFPEVPLAPADMATRARMRVWCKDIETFMSVSLAGTIFPANDRYELAKLPAATLDAYFERHPNKRLAEKKRAWIAEGYASPDARRAVLTYHKFLQKMEFQLGRSQWLVGSAWGLADIETAPYVAVLELLEFQKWWRDRLPRVTGWYDRMKARPAFRQAVVDVVPEQLRRDMSKRGAEIWPEVEAIIATAEPFNGKSPWAMRAEAL
jgi:glutathione S-transferase